MADGDQEAGAPPGAVITDSGSETAPTDVANIVNDAIAPAVGSDPEPIASPPEQESAPEKEVSPQAAEADPLFAAPPVQEESDPAIEEEFPEPARLSSSASEAFKKMRNTVSQLRKETQAGASGDDRVAELEGTIRRLQYPNSQEFQDRYIKPLGEQAARFAGIAKQLNVDEQTVRRIATASTEEAIGLMANSNMPPAVQIHLSNELTKLNDMKREVAEAQEKAQAGTMEVAAITPEQRGAEFDEGIQPQVNAMIDAGWSVLSSSPEDPEWPKPIIDGARDLVTAANIPKHLWPIAIQASAAAAYRDRAALIVPQLRDEITRLAEENSQLRGGRLAPRPSSSPTKDKSVDKSQLDQITDMGQVIDHVVRDSVAAST